MFYKKFSLFILNDLFSVSLTSSLIKKSNKEKEGLKVSTNQHNPHKLHYTTLFLIKLLAQQSDSVERN